MDEIERELKIKLPKDFKEISLFYSGGFLGNISHYAITNKKINPNIAQETLELRKSVNLPHNFIVLAEPPESLIVLNIENNQVIWLYSFDINKLRGGNFSSKPDIWLNYTSFFQTLLLLEEEIHDSI